MKRQLTMFLASLALVCTLATVPVYITGCTTSAQRKAFNTIGTLETATTASVDGYFAAVVRGQAPTNGLPLVSSAYNKFQGGVLVALDLVQNNTNALAPSSLQVLSSDVISLVGQFRKP